jgi:flagellum-specific peptidoglycan hydrolase FlgJ
MADPRTTFLKTAAPGAQAGAAEFGVPASVTLAHAVLESGWGKFHLGPANNYFGIKAFVRAGRVDVGPIASGFVVKQTHEVVGGRDIVMNARFRAYRSLGDSMRDHGHFLRANSRYAPAFAFSRDPNGFARAIAKAGYATDPGRRAHLAARSRSLRPAHPRRVARRELPRARAARTRRSSGAIRGAAATRANSRRSAGAGELRQ